MCFLYLFVEDVSYLYNLRNLWISSGPPEPLAVASRPGIAAHVIATFFPKAGLIFGEEADAFHPLRGLPGVELRNDQAHRAAVVGRNRGAVMHEREQRIFF